jgi:hypothetical protein
MSLLGLLTRQVFEDGVSRQQGLMLPTGASRQVLGTLVPLKKGWLLDKVQQAEVLMQQSVQKMAFLVDGPWLSPWPPLFRLDHCMPGHHARITVSISPTSQHSNT